MIMAANHVEPVQEAKSDNNLTPYAKLVNELKVMLI